MNTTVERSLEDRLSELRARVRSHAIVSARDTALEGRLRELVKNVNDCRNGGGSKHRALFVIGKSDSGKTFALEHLFAQIAEFQPTRNKYRELVQTLISIEAPRPCSLVDLGNQILGKLGLPKHYKPKSVPQFLDFVKSQLKERGVLYLHIDEAQHLIRHSTDFAVREIQDRLKQFTQIDGWPLHIIYSGVDDLALLVDTPDGQIHNRSDVFRLVDLKHPRDDVQVEKAVSATAELCGLNLDPALETQEFRGKLCRAGREAYGLVIVYAQRACFRALEHGRDVVTEKDFAVAYERHAACLPSDNIFTAKNWQQIDPAHARADITEPVKKARSRRDGK